MKQEISNKVMLIAYPDCMGSNLSDLYRLLDWHLEGAIGGLHILPFFPSSGDRGFAPIRYDLVEPRFGDWKSIEALAERYYLMFDFMVNHISAQSEIFADFVRENRHSKYTDFFIRYTDFWEGGSPTDAQLQLIYKRKPKAPALTVHFADGTQEQVWCTFSDEQVDINCNSEVARAYIRDVLCFLSKQGAAIIRLDAFAYAAKKAGTNCFFVEPDVFELLDWCSAQLRDTGAIVLPEIHEHYSIQQKLEAHGYYVYDFALPMLLLHALYYGQTQYLKHWLEICPRKQFTTLDTHDGIGVVDVRDLLPTEEVERTKEGIFRFGANVKKVYSTAAYQNLDIYQVNCTYYSALGEEDDAYLLARAVQFFAPGIPQVYYVGLLAGRNDLELVERTKEGRNINRHYYTEAEVLGELKRPVVKALLLLMRFRNTHPAFAGKLSIEDAGEGSLVLSRTQGGNVARLRANFLTWHFEITSQMPGRQEEIILANP